MTPPDNAPDQESFYAIRRIRAVLASGMWDGAWAKVTILGLLDDLTDARKALLFADGNSVVITGMPLALLYAEDCVWAQTALAAAGCHGRDYRSADLEAEHTEIMATLCPCGHPYSDHNKERGDGGPPFCSYSLSRRCGCNGLGLEL